MKIYEKSPLLQDFLRLRSFTNFDYALLVGELRTSFVFVPSSGAGRCLWVWFSGLSVYRKELSREMEDCLVTIGLLLVKITSTLKRRFASSAGSTQNFTDSEGCLTLARYFMDFKLVLGFLSFFL